MQQINRDNLTFELKIETLEDLWILSQFIVPEDRILATTERKVKIGNDNTKQIKKLIFVDLKTSKTTFDTSTLRISGTIQNETEFTAIGQSHSLNFNVNDKIKIQKQNLLKFEENLLKTALESKKTKNLLILLDKDELIASEFSDFNFTILFEKTGLGSKKYKLTEINEEEEKFKIIEETLKKDYSNIIFSGPGIYKEKLSKYIKDKIGLKIITHQFPDVSNSSIPKTIKSITENQIITNTMLAKENEVISKLLENINKEIKHVYGEQNTLNAINSGAIETLIISTKFINQKKEKGKYNEINEMMLLVEKLNGELAIINSKNETGKILDGFTGIAGILRY